MKQVLLIGMQHGNELLGDKLMNYIALHNPKLLESVDFVVGNPRAFKNKVRFIDTDMNRSYNKKSPEPSYEEIRANKVIELIQATRYNLVLDLHTTTAKQPPCVIMSDFTDATKKFLRCTDISTVVKMPKDITVHSLIGSCRQALSIEVNYEESSGSTLRNLVRSIVAFINNSDTAKEVTVYEVESLLRVDDLTTNPGSQIQNFKALANGCYPVLLGETAYESAGYLGFKAKKKYQLTV